MGKAPYRGGFQLELLASPKAAKKPQASPCNHKADSAVLQEVCPLTLTGATGNEGTRFIVIQRSKAVLFDFLATKTQNNPKSKEGRHGSTCYQLAFHSHVALFPERNNSPAAKPACIFKMIAVRYSPFAADSLDLTFKPRYTPKRGDSSMSQTVTPAQRSLSMSLLS